MARIEITLYGSFLLSISADYNPHVSLQPGILYFRPPKDLRCEVCRRHVSELPPFSRDFMPWMEKYEGEVLMHSDVPVWRLDEDKEKIWNQFFGKCRSSKDDERAWKRMVKALGLEEATFISAAKQYVDNTVDEIWLCRDCVVLTEDDIRTKLAAVRKAERREKER